MNKNLKLIFIFIVFLIYTPNSKAYTFTSSDIDANTKNTLNEVAKNWPSNLDSGRIALIEKAATLVNKGVLYPPDRNVPIQLELEKPPYMDCSDYVSWAFNHTGASDVGLSWWTGTYAENIGTIFNKIDKSELIPGDVALNNLSTTSEQNHIAIYIGNLNGTNYYLHSTRYNGVSGPQLRSGDGGSQYFLRYHAYSNLKNTSSGSSGGGGGLTTDDYSGLKPLETSNFNCETIFLNADGGEKELKKLLDGIFSIIQISAPIIAIALSILEYIKALANADSSMKKANKKTIIRVVMAIAILLLPLILDLLFHIFGLYDISRCQIGN